MKPYDVETAFAEIEEELIASMIRNMKRHRVEEVAEGKEWSMWQAEQLKALRAYKKKNKTRFSDRFKEINKQIEKAITEARAQGNMDEEIKILEAIKKGFTGYRKTDASVVGEFFKVNDRKLNALIKATKKDFQRGEQAILRMAEDQYRQIIFNAQVFANTGAGTYEQAVDMATKDFLSRGINCIEYKNGARHTMKDYADMAIRTAAKRAYLAGEGEKRMEWGISTVIVNKRGNACPKCVPFVGKVLIDDVYSGGSNKDGDYPLLSRAMELGLYHPRCKDTHTTYFPGVSTADDKWTKEELEVIGEEYKQEQKQMYAQRQVERFERMAKHSLDPENKKKYSAREKQWKNSPFVQSGGKATTGGKKYLPYDNNDEKDIAAAREYRKISRRNDIKRIAKNSGFTEAEIKQIKRHIFYNKHQKYDGYGMLTPDYDMAVAWKRLYEGNPEPRDILLLKHELLESTLEKEYNISVGEAHAKAKEIYDWEAELIKELGEEGEPYGLL